jgi:aerobic carbon-monoxide dehydrogenase large subunit
MNWVGRRLPRYEDPVLLRRGARVMRFVRSPVARGRILAIEMPAGGQLVTASDLNGVKPMCPRLLRPEYVPIAQPVLAGERVTYVGEPIAAIIAETAAEAEDIAEQVAVEIAAPVVDVDQALAPSAPLVHDIAANNTVIDASLEAGDVDAAFASAAEVIEFTFESRRQSAMPLERGAPWRLSTRRPAA